MSMISDQVEGVVRNALNRFAKNENVEVERLALWVEPSTDGLELFILMDLKKLRQINFRDLITTMENLMFKGLGFDISTDLPAYFTDFMKRVQNDKGIDFFKQNYFIRLVGGKPVMFLFLNGQKAIFDELADSISDPLAKFKISLENIVKS